jgi:peptide/nickel transport system permease protein
MSFAAVLLVEASLSFLGVGVQPPQATWGTMLREGVSQQAVNPWLPWPPGIAITLTVLAFNTLGDTTLEALRRTASPRRSRRRRTVPTTAAPVVVTSDVPAADGDLLTVRDLVVEVPGTDGAVAAVRDLSFTIAPGEIVGLVGESGSGKTLTALAVAGLLPEGVSIGGNSRMSFDGTSIVAADAHRTLRGREVAMVFQDPSTALNPALTIGRQLTEPLRIHHGMSRAAARQQAIEVLDRVGVAEPASRLGDYPHQFSGGMAQRVMIAMALVARPKLLIADEPTTALDVTTQRQVLELLVRLCEEEGMAMLFITHDLGIVAQVCDRAVVMYAGEAVEAVDVFDLFAAPRHPYTRALLGSVPTLEGEGRLRTIDGRVPGPDEVIEGCRFAPRCPDVEAPCTAATQQFVELGRQTSHFARCRRASEEEESREVSGVQR